MLAPLISNKRGLGRTICVHGRPLYYCVRCKGGAVCDHKKLRSRCVVCKGSQICPHLLHKQYCKKCGTHTKLRTGGFTVEEIRTIGSVVCCEFPGCFVRLAFFCSDHSHICANSHKRDDIMCRECCRGEICAGHNRLLADLDKHPEWTNDDALGYMQRRPFRR